MLKLVIKKKSLKRKKPQDSSYKDEAFFTVNSSLKRPIQYQNGKFLYRNLSYHLATIISPSQKLEASTSGKISVDKKEKEELKSDDFRMGKI